MNKKPTDYEIYTLIRQSVTRVRCGKGGCLPIIKLPPKDIQERINNSTENFKLIGGERTSGEVVRFRRML